MNSPGNAGTADITRKAEVAKAQLRQLSATLSSADGAATVTVNASGALQKLAFGPKARELPLDRLAAAVVATAQRAQAQAARQITAIMAPVIGTDSDAMRFLEEQFPAPELPEEQPAAPQERRFVVNEEQAAPPPPPRPPAPPRPPRPPVDGGDEEFGSFMRRDW
ncbi:MULTISPECIES: YbaB/EbfC family nucleoid-associated protein [Amycolatopsis]|uniref:YbaB/EbfC DNA-binding family protein n=2 Tax=Amycolatopsis TaxID=1813 RepID=A0A1I3V1D0_9PSEU|nr:YbaB/EbfC family nucleoid-associated protein [Amycolatopsis sacchari]SFJ89474.1 YbaB/EbfC DNA-binding family protein [Amycolatopsis sacchari]